MPAYCDDTSVGPITATAIVAAAGNGAEFKNDRHFAAWLGLVPRQHTSGDRRIMMGITKRGDRHLRTLLVHGARAVVRTTRKKTDSYSRWVNDLHERRGHNKAIVAVANKNCTYHLGRAFFGRTLPYQQLTPT